MEDDEEEDKEYSFDDMSEVLAMAAPVINVHLIKRLEVGLGDVTTLMECVQALRPLSSVQALRFPARAYRLGCFCILVFIGGGPLYSKRL